MARLTQQNSAAPQQVSLSVPQTTPPVPQNCVKGSVTAGAKKLTRRYPRWFFPGLSLAVLLTLGQFGYKAMLGGMEFARDHGWQPRVKHKLTAPMPGGGWYAVAPQGDRYLLSQAREGSAYLELHKSSGELLWKCNANFDAPVFSQDGTQIFNGTEALDSSTGKVVATVPVQKSAYSLVWAASGSRVTWQRDNWLRVWDRATNKTRFIILKNMTVGSSKPVISPDGRWLATLAYDKNYRGNVAVWDLNKSTDPELYPIGTPSGGGCTLAFSPDNQRLLFAGREAKGYSIGSSGYVEPRDIVSIWTLDSSRPVYELFPKFPAILAEWSTTGDKFALRGGDQWSVYDITSGKKLWNASHRGNHFLNKLYFTGDNKLYYLDHSVTGWSLEYWDLTNVVPQK